MILARYLTVKYLINFLIVLAIAISVILLFDFIEIAKFFSNNRIGLVEVLEISFLKNYKNLSKILPFIVLISSIITFYQLNKSYELIILRTTGISAIKIALPVILVNIIISILVIFLFNPLGSLGYRVSQKLMDFNNEKKDFSFIFNSTGIWFKTDYEGGLSYVFHIKNISDDYKASNDVNIYALKNGEFRKKIYTNNAEISRKLIKLINPITFDNQLNISYDDELSFKIRLDEDFIKDNFKSPEDVLIYKIPSYIYSLTRLGINSNEFQLYFINMALLPLYYATMVIWGLVFTLSLPRNTNKEKKIAIGLLLGFTMYFIINLSNVYALTVGGVGMILGVLPVGIMFYLSVHCLKLLEHPE